MNEILKFLIEFCSFLYERDGFRFIDSAVSKSFGNAAIILGTSDLNIRFTRERGQLFADFKSNHYGKINAYSWYSIDVVRQLITGENQYYSIMNEDNAIFLKENINKIISIFSEPNVQETIMRLKKLERIRAKKIFS